MPTFAQSLPLHNRLPFVSDLTTTARADIVARPLFAADRKPALQASEVAKSVAKPAHNQSLTLELAGTLLTDKIGVALLIDANEAPHRLRVGQRIEGWTVEKIRADRVHLHQGRKTVPIMLREEKPDQRHTGRAG
ncbi:MAG: hypothetical protein ACR2RE_24300 [Geminicoccaceae bacterium]